MARLFFKLQNKGVSFFWIKEQKPFQDFMKLLFYKMIKKQTMTVKQE